MGTGASKARNLNVSQEPSLEKQKGQSDGRDSQSGQPVHLTREEQSRNTNVSEQACIQSKEHDSTNLSEQSQIVWPSGSTNTETESPESSKNLHSSLTQGDPNESTQSKVQEGKKSVQRSLDEADHRQPGGNCQKEEQHSSKQRESQTHDFSMGDGVLQPGCAMQRNFQHQGHPFQGGIQVPFYPMPGGMQQPGYAMQGVMQHPGYAMQGEMQQPGYAMQGGMQQPGFGMQGGMQQPGYFMQGGMQQPGYFMQGGMQQPGYSMQGAFQQPGYSIPGGIQQPGYVMQGGIQQPGYPMQDAVQQPGYPMQGGIQPPGCPMQQGAVQPPGYPMQGGGQQQVYPMQRVVQQQGHPMQGAAQQSGYPIQKGIQEPGFALQSRTDHAIQGGDQQRGYTMKERGPQPPDTSQGGPRGPQALSSVQPYQVCTDRDLPGEEHQPDQERQIEEQRPNTSFSETDGQQKLSKSPQPHSKGSHKINFAVDPAVLEFVSSSRHNEELTKLTNERQLKFTWKTGSNHAVLEYSGIKDESREAECIEVMQSFLQTFEKCDLPIHDEIRKEVQDDQYNIRTILGRDPPLLKYISSYNDGTKAALRIVASKNDIERHKALLENKIEEIFKKATFQSKSITNISKSHLNLLKEINFCENLHEQYPKVEVHLDPVKGEIHLKGPKDQVGIAIQKFQDQQNAATEKEFRLNSDSFEILATKDGKSAVVKALRDENIKAVVEYHLSVNSVKVLGSSEEHAQKAASIISGIITVETVPFSENYISLLKGDGWSRYCEEIQEKKGVLIRKETSGEICVVGLKSNALKAAQKLQFYLNNNAELVEEIECDSIDVKKYLLRCVSSIQETYGVKVQNEEDSLNFWVSGRDQELKKAIDTIINKFSKDIEVSTQVVNQPGLTNFLKSSDLDVRIKKIEDQENCVIRIEKNLGPRGTKSPSHPADRSATSGFVTSSGSSALVTTHGHTLSWKSGDIMKEQADLLVIPQGVCFDGIRADFDQVTIQAATKLTAGNIYVSPSFTLPCTQVIHCCCSYWNSDGEKILRAIVKSCILKAEELRVTSIAFPVMGTGNLGFPPLEASRIMLDETIKACEKSPHTTLKDIRFVIYYKDQALIGAFKQEVMKLQNPTNTAPNTDGTGVMNVEVIQGDLTQETTEAIVNVIGPDMDMCNFGQLSKIIAETGGLQVQQECRQMGKQSPGSAVMTSGGRLAVKHIIHIVTGSSDKTHLQRCLEEGLRLADTNGIKSISVPAIGTGGYGLPAAESARIIFQALNNMGGNFTNISKVRIVVFQAQMVNVFQQQQHQKSSLSPLTAVAAPSMFNSPIKVDVVTGDLTKESSEAIVNVIGTDLNMNNFGQLSRVIAKSCGPQVQQELNQKGTQTPGSAVMTSGGGTLIARHIIHIVATTSDRQELETCLEEGLRLADANGIKSISVPAIGTGGFGLSGSESAQLVFQALNNMVDNFESISSVRIVVFQTQMVQAFQREQQTSLLPPVPSLSTSSSFGIPIKVDVVNSDLTQENSNAILNVVGTDLNMKNAGQLSNAIAQTCGPQVQQELNQKGTQAPGSAVMTSGGTLIAKHIIHLVAATADKQQLQTCLEEGLRLADANNIKSISIPAIGTGGFGLSPRESAQIVFQALSNMSGHFTSVSTIRVVVFQKQMTQAFLQEQQSSLLPRTTASRGGLGNMKAALPSSNLSVTVRVTGSKHNVEKAMAELKELFSSACITKKIDMEEICSLSDIQVNQLKQEAYKYDVEITVNKTCKSITLRGFSADLPDMVSKITDEISKGIKKEKKKQEDDNAHLFSSVVEWSYTLRGRKQVFDKTTNAKLEMAQSKNESITVLVNGKQFSIDPKKKTGQCQGELMTLTRTSKEAKMSEGIPLPDNWAPMPSHEKVTLVPLNTNSIEYQNVLRQFQATVPNVNVQKIERVQNPELYRTFKVKKQEMDKRCGGNSERKLFHGTDGKNINAINSQGFNRSFCGKNGTAYGHGVYFARDASYSLGFTGGAGGGGAMYLARVLVGEYCQGSPGFLTPPPKDPRRIDILYDSVVDSTSSSPAIFVVFHDTQCYPEYIIRF